MSLLKVFHILIPAIMLSIQLLQSCSKISERRFVNKLHQTKCSSWSADKVSIFYFVVVVENNPFEKFNFLFHGYFQHSAEYLFTSFFTTLRLIIDDNSTFNDKIIVQFLVFVCLITEIKRRSINFLSYNFIKLEKFWKIDIN